MVAMEGISQQQEEQGRLSVAKEEMKEMDTSDGEAMASHRSQPAAVPMDSFFSNGGGVADFHGGIVSLTLVEVESNIHVWDIAT